MISFAAAIFVTSLLGSMHCVGMCGPMALWASGVGQSPSSPFEVMARLTTYHLGRLFTFAIVGAVAGLLGGLITAGGDWLGWQQSAARLAGSAMVGLGVWKALNWWQPLQAAALPMTASELSARRLPWVARLSQGISRRLAKLRPSIMRLPGGLRAFAIGVVTTWLPCGWLYLFALVAAATAAVGPALVVMLVFWIGTLPALTALVAGAVGVSPRFRPAMPLLAAGVLVITGMYTASGRASTDLIPLGQAAQRYSGNGSTGTDAALMSTMQASKNAGPSTRLEQMLRRLVNEPLPCCDPVDAESGVRVSAPAVGTP